MHKSYDKYTGDTRLALLKDLSSKLTKQKNVFLKKQINDLTI